MLGGHQESQAERSCEEDGSVLSSLLHSQVYGAAGNIYVWSFRGGSRLET